MQKCSYLVSINFSFTPMIKIHFTFIFHTLNFILQCCTVTFMTEMQALQGEIALIEFNTGY